MSYKSLDDLRRIFQPQALTSNSKLLKGTVGEKLLEGILNPNGKVYEYSTIKSNIQTFVNKDDVSAKPESAASSPGDKTKTSSPAAQNVAKTQFQAIGPGGPISLGDADYWDKVQIPSNIVEGLDRTAIFLIKEPRLGPMNANTDVVGSFLNNMPTHIANQMTPYLDVELIYNNDPMNFTRTPGVLRFLLGSVPVSNLSRQDSAIFKSRSVDRVSSLGAGEQGRQGSAQKAGIEAFLMPQSLNDMDRLGIKTPPSSTGQTSYNRAAPVKPFTPLMSIESFDMNTKGTGFGMIPVGRANLKLKLHDRARMSEIADLMRGAEGFNSIFVRTRYGWSCPDQGSNNEYTKFVNEKLNLTQFWDIVQINYSFDQGGQVSYTIVLATRKIQDVINGRTLDYSPRMIAFNEKTQKLLSTQKILQQSGIDVSASITTAITDAASKGFFTQKDKTVTNALVELKKQLKDLNRKQPGKVPFSDAEIESFINELNSLRDDKANQDTFAKVIEQDIKEGWQTQFDNMDRTDDPFLPDENPKRIQYFGNPERVGSLVKAIKNFEKDNAGNKDLESASDKVISFGKLFSHFMGKPLQKDVDELQIIFYTMNNYCGPMSGRPIAEFPMDMISLRRSYAEVVKRTRTKNITFDEFLTIVNNSNFNNPRAIGYDRTSLYKTPSSKDSTAKAEMKEDTSAQEAEWFAKYNGKFTPPQLEIQVDDVKNTEPVPGRSFVQKKIRRVHIFDKSSTVEENRNEVPTISDKVDRVRSEYSVIKIGSNGSTVITVSGNSKTNSLQDTIFAQRAYNNKGAGEGGTAIGADGLGDEGAIPLRITPGTLTLTSLGCPIARNYQSYYIDFNTGTQLDNRYKVVELSHNITPGKFVTTWRFVTDGAFGSYVPVKVGQTKPVTSSTTDPAENTLDVSKKIESKPKNNTRSSQKGRPPPPPPPPPPPLIAAPSPSPTVPQESSFWFKKTW